MIRIITAMNNPDLNEELKNEEIVEVIGKDIQYKEGIIEILENNKNIDYIIIDSKLPGQIEIEKLLKEILEKNEKIKIIITIKKGNKNKIIINNKNIIKIYYENKINLDKIKNYKNTDYEKKQNLFYKIKQKNKIKEKLKKLLKNKILKRIKIELKINKKIHNKKIKNKIITVFGERNIGKSMTIIKLAYYLKYKKNKILIIELNKENPSIHTIFGSKKYNKKIKNNKTKNKEIYIKKIKNKKFKNKYADEKIIKNIKTKINRNIDLISYNKLLNYKNIQNIGKKYNYIIIEIYSKEVKNKIKQIIKISDNKLFLLRANLTGIKNSKKIIEDNNLKNIKIIINKNNKYSVDDKIIKTIFNEEIIGRIKYNNSYDKLINSNLKNIKFEIKKIRRKKKNILEKII